MNNKKLNAKKRAYQHAQIIIKKDMYLEPIPAGGGLIHVGVSFDMERIAAAEVVLVEAGHSGRQANVAIKNIIKDVVDGVEKCIGLCV